MIRPVLMLVGVVALLAGCAGTPRVYGDQQWNANVRSVLTYAGGGRDLAVEALGSPFGMNQAAFSQAVASGMRNQIIGVAPVNFTATPGPSARPPYRIVLLFNGPPQTDGGDVCALGPRLPTAPAERPIRVEAAFCSGPDVLSEATGRVDGVTGPQDPRFRRLIGDLTRALFPLPDIDGDDERPPFMTSGGFIFG